ncbi:transposase [Methylocystis sp. H62]|nr:transposase [Methylocystis sp. H62]
MPAERITMRQAREIIRLKTASVSAHEISRRLGMPRSGSGSARTRGGRRALLAAAGGKNDAALEAALYANRRSKRGHRRVEEPDWANVHRELKRKHVTLMILWDEYIAENPGGYRYSRFCELYRAFARTLSVTMRQTHAAGERLCQDPSWLENIRYRIKKAVKRENIDLHILTFNGFPSGFGHRDERSRIGARRLFALAGSSHLEQR